MTALRTDVVIIGAGIVGVCTAIELRKRGLDVILIDRKSPGLETSYGNAGVIQREGVHPYVFSRDWRTLLGVALGQRSEARYQLSSLVHVAPFLWRYFRASSPAVARRTFEANVPLFADCLSAHGALAAEAGVEALIRKQGWLRVSRADETLKEAEGELKELRDLGLGVDIVEGDALSVLEPHLNAKQLAGAIHYRDPWTCSDPGALVGAYAALFLQIGGQILRAEVTSLAQVLGGWRVSAGNDILDGDSVVLAAGPWSKPMLDDLGVYLPMGIKRGYHCHYSLDGNAALTRPIVDDDNGFVMAPMAQGLRITTGAEFARLDAPRNPVQLTMVEPLAAQLIPLGVRRDREPWMGARPVFPDLLPVMGAAPGLPGLFLNFGHGHQGFTLGPVAGRHVAQILTGETPAFDPAPYLATRF